MLRFTASLFAIFLSISACTTVERASRLSAADVRQIADAKVHRSMRIDLHQYEVSEPHYIARKEYWSVTYYLKANKHVAFSVHVSDKIQKTFIDESNAGIFEGPLNPKPDLH